MNSFIIFGFSSVGRQIYEKIDKRGFLAFCDNNSKKYGEYDGFPIISVEDALRKFAPYQPSFYIASLFLQEEMKNQLLSLGIKEEQIIADIPKEIVEYENNLFANRALTVRKKLLFEINIARHCNLNCRSCDHFSPLANEEFSDLEVMKKDYARLRCLFGSDGVERIYILGGEPLLNPQVDEYMSLSRETFWSAEIVLITNGLLLSRMTEAFWTVARENDITIAVTKYPINMNYDDLINLASDKGVTFEFFGNTEAGRTFWHTPIDIEGKQEPLYSFMNCRLSNYCIQLDKGKLYTCTWAATIDIFERFFQKQLSFGENDVIDIYKVSSKEEILNRLAKPMEFCKYCNIRGRTYGHRWGISEKKIEEWT